MRKYESENEFKVFLYFVTHAAVHPTIYKGRVLQRGQLALSITDACAKIGISKRSYRTVMTKLICNTTADTESDTEVTRKQHRIDTEVTRWFTIITILKFDDYVICEDSDRHGSDTEISLKRHGSDTESDTKTPLPPNPPKNPPFIQKENEKENLSPTPPIKEKDKEKEKASPQPSLRKKNTLLARVEKPKKAKFLFPPSLARLRTRPRI